jgi:hypothetical protein
VNVREFCVFLCFDITKKSSLSISKQQQKYVYIDIQLQEQKRKSERGKKISAKDKSKKRAGE